MSTLSTLNWLTVFYGQGNNMTISKTYLQNSEETLASLEQRYDTFPKDIFLSAPVTSLNKLCYNQMREIAKRRTANCNSKQLEQTLKVYRDYAVRHINP